MVTDLAPLIERELAHLSAQMQKIHEEAMSKIEAAVQELKLLEP